ncbi:MAG: 16S rRNA (cytosine(967)-C(5))-methyltransferase RsmB [Lactobacillales bacterium]|jgi:16S rRNA (cytosine967-C5)-methyltransferase|nr:16S rRNA (cytosine(967)-C(5))-methyltransferase RsmB [Lactobacillales bacterium]
MKTVRELALEALYKIEKGQAYSNLLLNEYLNSNGLNDADKRLFSQLVYGVVARKMTLQWMLKPYVKGRMKPMVRLALQMAVYQIVYLDKIPRHAIVDEAVKITKKADGNYSSKFVNAVLRNFEQRPIEDAPIEVKYSMPRWLVDLIINQLGYGDGMECLESLLVQSKANARVTIDRDEAIAILEEEGYENVLPSLISPVGITTPKGVLAKSKLFHEGTLTIQDESSQIVAQVMQLEPHHQVLDACAAPGGKTMHIATYLNETGKVHALDIHEHKINLIKDNAIRQHLTDRVETHLLDARKAETIFDEEQFDRILVDAPCSGLGLMRRKPDIKYAKTEEEIEHLPAIQLEILEKVCKLVRKGGIITYSTCTMNEAENAEVVNAFIEAHEGEFALAEITPITPNLERASQNAMIEIYPHYFNSDGFFIANIKRL